MSDLLAQVSTCTETQSNAGNAVLYETVLTIVETKSASGLRVLAVNILGRFLLSNDKNIRYVALTSLQRLVQSDHAAVQRHRGTIVECLRQTDASVNKRALELSFALVNESNIRVMMKELQKFLRNCSPELKEQCTSGIFLSAEKFSPSKRWHIDTIMQTLITAGESVRDDAVSHLIQLIIGSSELHGYIVQRLYKSIRNDIVQQPLVQVASWCIGEYGDLLLHGVCDEEEPIQITVLFKNYFHIPFVPSALAYALHAVLCYIYCSFCLETGDCPKQPKSVPLCQNRIRRVVSIYGCCHDVELQQRAVEYNALFKKYDHMRGAILEKMPLPEKSNTGIVESIIAENKDIAENPAENNLSSNGPASHVTDLLGLLENSADNLLTPAIVGTVNQNDSTPLPSIEVYNNGSLQVEFSFLRPSASPTLLIINSRAINNSSTNITDFLLQAAVPKSVQLQLQAPSGNLLAAFGEGSVTQSIRLLNPQKVPLRMRLRLSFTHNGNSVLEVCEVNNFPEGTWQLQFQNVLQVAMFYLDFFFFLSLPSPVLLHFKPIFCTKAPKICIIPAICKKKKSL
ncbi:hypothetical protein AB205_0187000 [Aquarana catesbeiana]|uniref:GAE domain-containing protein n=1 Tax=Aquarana catesbeiana TaxID=8400 RepID=A0A2G9S6L0_AQUCT|nr:hypothetical protein AB205_0187000 [Aquarana catesbeiana]